MRKADILEELLNLARGDRREILERIWEMEEADLLQGAQPEAGEKALLDRELVEYNADPHGGAGWKDVEARRRQQIKS
ncbi:MAG TPA: hypothetical protein VH595_11465 [Verrucomicrobiae bacterium]|jgi:hypothetical protein|nr:hypothetical protein [Verrucomicrobiae bacterium]